MKSSVSKPVIGFIGQGFIGKNYANDFERRGYTVIRYAKEPEFEANQKLIQTCDIVFIAVPTPTTPQGFDDSLVRSVMKLIGKGKIAVIKSTILPGTTASIQKSNPDISVFHSPEFLTEATAARDAAHPQRNVVGMPIRNAAYKKRAEKIMSVLPEAPYKLICSSEEAELIKYGGNCFLYTKIVYMNMLYDYAQSLGCDWKSVAEAVGHDPRIGTSHMMPVHSSGRGAGGNCFIKDFEALISGYKTEVRNDKAGIIFLESMRNKNYDLLRKSKKDLAILEKVVGKKKK